jgi:(1->4)-alpha-D-glucan 1-alpha-D-glucosylmutase
VALNEVGCDPAHFGSSPEQFHRAQWRRQQDLPRSMTTISTHDTKRSEDVRARLLALAELPDEWGAAVARWRARAGRPSPVDAATDYLLWQTLVGAFPIGADRLRDYLGKATREAKLHTSWTDPDPAYDEALARHVDAVLGDAELVADVRSWVEDTLAAAGRSNALAQKLVQLTMPGIPDVYQGQELDDFSLVDPDNRRPVDYREREAALDLLAADPAAAPAKLRVVAGALRARRTHPGSFAGGYEPLPVSGPAARHAVAYRRGEDVAVVVTRLPVGLARRGGWDATTVTLPAGTWTDVLTGREATGALADLLAELPVALLTRTAG